ncbi:MAG: alpha/beta hydrolase [Acidimicrobiales bacterium]
MTSKVLVGNPLGDPVERPLWVYLPPGYDTGERRYPVVYVLQGYNSHVAMWGNRRAFELPYPESADELFASGAAAPCIVVFVDAWTAYGGSQFVDSPGTGKYHSYFCDEVVPFVDGRYRTMADPAHRGVQGHSSGGFGALVSAMLRPDLFGALASHAGDAYYELMYIPEFARSARALRAYDGSIDRWWEDFRSRTPFAKPADFTLLMMRGVAACFSAADDGTPLLPFEPTTGRLVDDVWQRWLAWDPLRMVPAHAEALRGLRGVWLDGGRSDEWFLELGAQALRDALAEVGAPEVHFELFDGGHGRIDHRYPLALAYLSERLS